MHDDRSMLATAAALCAMVDELLETTGTTPADDLMALGADSLTAMALVGRIRERWGVTMSFGDAMRHSGIADLADRIEQGRAGAAAGQGVGSAALFDD